MANQITVLLVDDHAMVREGVPAFFVTQPDITVVAEAGSGEEAVKAGRAICARCDPDGSDHAQHGRGRGDAESEAGQPAFADHVPAVVSRSFSSGFAGLLPLLAKLWKDGGLLLDVASGFVSMMGRGLSAVSGSFRPEVVALLAGLGALVSFLVIFGAKRLFSLGESS